MYNDYLMEYLAVAVLCFDALKSLKGIIGQRLSTMYYEKLA